jgi:hypothetical protein
MFTAGIFASFFFYCAEAALKVAQDALAEVVAKVADLKARYDTSVGQKNALRAEAEDLSEKLKRADELINGLAGEYTRWQASIGSFQVAIGDLVGDCLIASAFLTCTFLEFSAFCDTGFIPLYPSIKYCFKLTIQSLLVSIVTYVTRLLYRRWSIRHGLP